LDNGLVRARLRADGGIDWLSVADGPNVARDLNALTTYADRPAKWEAWNIDAGYERSARRVPVTGRELDEGGVLLRYRIGASPAAARVSLAEAEPFVRVALAVDWRERRTLLRCENVVGVDAPRAFFGAPHGVVERPASPQTPEERAKYEACGQRFGRIHGTAGGMPAGFALLARDTYGWSVGPGDAGAVRLGHSLLRGTTWPDEHADVGAQHFDLAFMPTCAASHGEVVAAWRRFAYDDEAMPALFWSDDPGVLVVATKPADDRDGIIVRVRECDGVSRDVSLTVAARAREVASVDALERPLQAEQAALHEGSIHLRLGGFSLRTLRVRFA
jgi:alpha-mannosidase